MPRFYFDTYDGVRRVHDSAGIDLACPTDVPSEAESLLFDLGYAEILKGQPRRFTTTVRNAAGRGIYRATATLDIDWRP